MATHCNILARKIAWTEEPGRLQTIGSQRVDHDLAQHTLLKAEKQKSYFHFGGKKQHYCVK